MLRLFCGHCSLRAGVQVAMAVACRRRELESLADAGLSQPWRQMPWMCRMPCCCVPSLGIERESSAYKMMSRQLSHSQVLDCLLYHAARHTSASPVHRSRDQQVTGLHWHMRVGEPVSSPMWHISTLPATCESCSVSQQGCAKEVKYRVRSMSTSGFHQVRKEDVKVHVKQSSHSAVTVY